MPLSNPTQLLKFLDLLGVRPKKGLSQNFLIDANIIQKMLQEAEIGPQDTVLEIGSGPGAITEALCKQGAKVIAVEKDRNYAEALKRFDSVQVFSGDILDFDFSSVPKGTKVLSNLPFHLTAPILTSLAPHTDLFSTITVIVQEEVARRITAKSKTKEFGSLTVFLDFYSDANYAFKVSRNCFYPRPKVDSAVVKLCLHPPPPIDPDGFFAIVRRLFQQRRKMVKTTLKDARVGEFLEQLRENPKARPEDLSLEVLLKLIPHLQSVC